MAFDGLVVSAVTHELNTYLLGGRIGKIAQPEKDELIITIRNNRKNYKLLLSSMASMPKIHLTQLSKINPITAPNFCMLLRKHLVGGLITSIQQPDFERIIIIHIENLDELGEKITRKLIIEIMGRHSNIILTNQDDLILDAIKRVGAQISSVREVFPNRPYILPPKHNKKNPKDLLTLEAFKSAISCDLPISKALYHTITGFSPSINLSLCLESQLNEACLASDLPETDLTALYTAFTALQKIITSHTFTPLLYQDSKNQFLDYAVVPLKQYQDHQVIVGTSISQIIEDYYLEKDTQSRLRQKSSDLRKLVHTHLERGYKKLEKQNRQIKDTENREKFRIIGDLIQANLYRIQDGDAQIEVEDYYNQQAKRILELDTRLTPVQNAQKYFNKYNKKKRTLVALTNHIKGTKAEIAHLESVQYALEHALTEADLLEVKDELMATGYLRFRQSKAKKALKKASPLHFIASTGHHIYVGKNNYQNDWLVNHFSKGGDWWFHAKNMPGSHVIVQADGEMLPDQTYEEAAGLAAYYSKGGTSEKVSIDYTLKKHIKKPAGSAPGFVIYSTNYSMVARPNTNDLTRIED